MSNIDDLFRDGLGERKPAVPTDLWKKIAAQKAPVGEQVDRLFATALGERQAPVPAGMWARIVAARRPAVSYASYALLLLLLFLFAGGALTWHLQPADAASKPAFPIATEAAGATQVQSPPPTAAATGPDGIAVRQTDHSTQTPASPRPQTQAPTTKQQNSFRSEKAATDATDRGARSAIKTIAATQAVTTLSTSLLAIPSILPEPGPVRMIEAITFRNSHRHRYRGEVLLGAAYANQSFGLQQGEAQRLRDLREVSEFPELSYQFTARLRYRLRGRLHLLAGLTYAELRNQIEYERSLPKGRELVRSNNRIRMLELPLLASLELPGRRLRLNLNAGPLLQLTTGISGSYLDPDSATPLDLKDSGQYRRGVGLGWTASLTTTYPLGKTGSTQLLLEPFFKHYPRSFTTAEAPLSERYWMAGLQLGLRKSL